jgi:hypothetical protein
VSMVRVIMVVLMLRHLFAFSNWRGRRSSSA